MTRASAMAATLCLSLISCGPRPAPMPARQTPAAGRVIIEPRRVVRVKPRPTPRRRQVREAIDWAERQIEKLRADLRNLNKDAAARTKALEGAPDPGEPPIAAGQGPIGRRAVR
jgi:hypothetical protein